MGVVGGNGRWRAAMELTRGIIYKTFESYIIYKTFELEGV